ncbi:MAG: DUF3999 family protein [Ferruginibacter sp.]
MKRSLILYHVLFLLSLNAVGQYQQYKYKRELQGIKDQWQQLILPADIFGKISNNFSDIRIIGIKENKDTIEAPYVLEIASEKNAGKEVPFKLINQSKNDKGYYFSFEIAGQVDVSQIHLDFKQQNFDWKINLEASHNQQQWFTIVEDYRILSIHNEQTQFKFTKLEIPPSRYRYYRLFINAATDPGFIKASLLQNEKVIGSWVDYQNHSFKTENQKTNKQTIVDVTMVQPVPVAWVKIFVKNNFDYYRPITINYITDSFKTETGWHYNFSLLQSGTLNSFDKNEFTFNSTILKKLSIIIENQDNEPLQIDSIQIKGYRHILKARFIEKARYYLLYGNKDVARPNYDIESFTDKIPKIMSALEMGEEEFLKTEIKKPVALFQDKKWLWILMAAIIFLLGWFTVRMMKRPDNVE